MSKMTPSVTGEPDPVYMKFFASGDITLDGLCLKRGDAILMRYHDGTGGWEIVGEIERPKGVYVNGVRHTPFYDSCGTYTRIMADEMPKSPKSVPPKNKPWYGSFDKKRFK